MIRMDKTFYWLSIVLLIVFSIFVFLEKVITLQFIIVMFAMAILSVTEAIYNTSLVIFPEEDEEVENDK